MGRSITLTLHQNPSLSVSSALRERHLDSQLEKREKRKPGPLDHKTLEEIFIEPSLLNIFPVKCVILIL